MRIAVTVDSPQGSEDVLIVGEETATVGELKALLRRRTGCAVHVPGRSTDLVARCVLRGARLSERHRRRIPSTCFQLHVVDGPDCGVVRDLPTGAHVIGRSGAIAWRDPRLSRRHAVVEVAPDGVHMRDLGSSHGTVLDGQPCLPGESVEWRVDTIMEVGSSKAVLRAPQREGARTQLSTPGRRCLLRPPRVQTRADSVRIAFPTPPEPAARPSVPWPALVVPVALGIAVAAFFQRPEYMLFTLMGPALALGHYLSTTRRQARKQRGEWATYRADADAARECLMAAVKDESRRWHEAFPDAAATLMMATVPGRRLWERRPEDADFLCVRVGTGDQPSTVQVTGDSAVPILRDVPLTLDLKEARAVGIVGEKPLAARVLRWLVAQLVVYHAPTDLAVTPPITAADESAWTRWLPHVRDEPAAAESTWQVTTSRGIVEIACAESELDLPEHTEAIVLLGQGESLLAWQGVQRAVHIEGVSGAWAEDMARGLAPFEAGEAAGALPTVLRLVDLLGIATVSPDVIAERWATPRSGLSAVIGRTSRGPLAIDLATDGPHLLLAGMTGSGKTALLQALVLSLAVTYSPQALTFVLVDYKGDSAFAGYADLPHVVGKVTDLDPDLVRRALLSLRAELQRRKRLLARAGARDIAEYQAAGVGPALPRLVMVIDEFAELVQELPEFVEGLVSLARSGRSLGIHLVLATQRPNGAVSPAVRANTAIRIALRVADTVDSSDVIGVPDAAEIDSHTPGRGFVRIGARDPLLFHTARVDCPAAVVDEPGSLRVEAWNADEHGSG